ncbi:MAG: hypothetical protein QOF48_1792 [Verrucomicrobiota bacterium]|jgi:hypothetical protein
MWKSLADWLLTFLNMARELQEHRTTIRRLEERLRDTEEALKLIAQEVRHARELDSVQREKLLLQLERELTRQKMLPQSRRATEEKWPKPSRQPKAP